MPLSIGTVVITNGSANYADRWIQPHFAIGIQQLNGYHRRTVLRSGIARQDRPERLGRPLCAGAYLG